jgi:hypothetical protein
VCPVRYELSFCIPEDDNFIVTAVETSHLTYAEVSCIILKQPTLSLMTQEVQDSGLGRGEGGYGGGGRTVEKAWRGEGGQGQSLYKRHGHGHGG